MRRLLAILLAAFALLLLLLVVAALTFRFALRSGPHVPDKAVLQLEVSGSIEEYDPEQPLAYWAGLRHVTVRSLLRALEKAESDPRIAAVWMRIGPNDLGWAKLDELRAAIERVRQRGKYVIAQLGDCDDRLYYLALAADRIELAPEALALIDGLMARYTFLKGTLDKLGIEAQVEAQGKYKSAGEALNRESMSPPAREEAEALLDDNYERLLAAIAAGRQRSAAEVRGWLDDPSYTPADLVARGMVDGNAYPDQIRRQLKHKLGLERDAKLEPVDAVAYAGDEEAPGWGPTIALVYAVGTIGGEKSGFDPVFGRTIGWKTLGASLREAAADDSIEAIVLRIDSPGGAMLASDLIWREVQNAARKKPVVASMSDLAASGGYYIAMGAQRILADPSTLTGSIGVVATLFSLDQAYQKLGFSHTVLKRGRWSDATDNSRALTEAERARFGAEVRRAYRRFVAKVAAARGRGVGEIESVAQGRVWSGAQALKLGLVDEIGGLSEAIAAARRLAKIPADEEINTIVFPKPRGFLEWIAEGLDVRRRLELPEPLQLAQRAGSLLRLGRGEPLALMPWVPELW